jgi:hypothetical protein
MRGGKAAGSLMARARILWIRSWLRNALRPSLLEMSTSTAGHMAGERSDISSFICVCAGINGMCPAAICMRIVIFPWPLTDSTVCLLKPGV